MAKLQARTPKGMRDFLPGEMRRRDYVFGVLRGVFESFGFEPISTPVMELQSTLMGNYGEEAEKLIFHAKHTEGKEDLALRYDLTVPLSRFYAEHENALPLPFRRYHIAPVYRGERPGRGRYREFYQCDADIVGIKGMSADAECVCVVQSALIALGFQEFTIKINNRKLLTGIGVYAGVPDHQLGDLYRTIDKTDKIGLDGVASELRKNNIPEDVVGRMVDLLGFQEQDKTAHLRHMWEKLAGIAIAEEALDELEELLNYLGALGVTENQTALDFTMVRGLGYYTGSIFETIITYPENLGSVQGGGRYDELIGLFRAQSLPTTGISLGVERLVDLMDQLNLYPAYVDQSKTQVLVTVFNDDLLPESMRLASELRAGGVKAETFMDTRRNLAKQFGYAEGKGIPLAAILGPDEVSSGQVKLKHLASREETTAPRDALAEKIASLL
jgi:histidyl-tRNA synthetase